MIKNTFCFTVIFVLSALTAPQLSLAICDRPAQEETSETKKSSTPISEEIIYHVVQRSFFDDDGDQHGDLNGLVKKLVYLQDVGVTSILALPLIGRSSRSSAPPNR